jgi:hypothetical protein
MMLSFLFMLEVLYFIYYVNTVQPPSLKQNQLLALR